MAYKVTFCSGETLHGGSGAGFVRMHRSQEVEDFAFSILKPRYCRYEYGEGGELSELGWKRAPAIYFHRRVDKWTVLGRYRPIREGLGRAVFLAEFLLLDSDEIAKLAARKLTPVDVLCSRSDGEAGEPIWFPREEEQWKGRARYYDTPWELGEVSPSASVRQWPQFLHADHASRPAEAVLVKSEGEEETESKSGGETNEPRSACWVVSYRDGDDAGAFSPWNLLQLYGESLAGFGEKTDRWRETWEVGFTTFPLSRDQDALLSGSNEDLDTLSMAWVGCWNGVAAHDALVASDRLCRICPSDLRDLARADLERRLRDARRDKAEARESRDEAAKHALGWRSVGDQAIAEVYEHIKRSQWKASSQPADRAAEAVENARIHARFAIEADDRFVRAESGVQALEGVFLRLTEIPPAAEASTQETDPSDDGASPQPGDPHLAARQGRPASESLPGSPIADPASPPEAQSARESAKESLKWSEEFEKRLASVRVRIREHWEEEERNAQPVYKEIDHPGSTGSRGKREKTSFLKVGALIFGGLSFVGGVGFLFLRPAAPDPPVEFAESERTVELAENEKTAALVESTRTRFSEWVTSGEFTELVEGIDLLSKSENSEILQSESLVPYVTFRDDLENLASVVTARISEDPLPDFQSFAGDMEEKVRRMAETARSESIETPEPGSLETDLNEYFQNTGRAEMERQLGIRLKALEDGLSADPTAFASIRDDLNGLKTVAESWNVQFDSDAITGELDKAEKALAAGSGLNSQSPGGAPNPGGEKTPIALPCSVIVSSTGSYPLDETQISSLRSGTIQPGYTGGLDRISIDSAKLGQGRLVLNWKSAPDSAFAEHVYESGNNPTIRVSDPLKPPLADIDDKRVLTFRSSGQIKRENQPFLLTENRILLLLFLPKPEDLRREYLLDADSFFGRVPKAGPALPSQFAGEVEIGERLQVELTATLKGREKIRTFSGTGNTSQPVIAGLLAEVDALIGSVKTDSNPFDEVRAALTMFRETYLKMDMFADVKTLEVDTKKEEDDEGKTVEKKILVAARPISEAAQAAPDPKSYIMWMEKNWETFSHLFQSQREKPETQNQNIDSLEDLFFQYLAYSAAAIQQSNTSEESDLEVTKIFSGVETAELKEIFNLEDKPNDQNFKPSLVVSASSGTETISRFEKANSSIGLILADFPARVDNTKVIDKHWSKYTNPDTLNAVRPFLVWEATQYLRQTKFAQEAKSQENLKAYLDLCENELTRLKDAADPAADLKSLRDRLKGEGSLKDDVELTLTLILNQP